MVLTTKFGGGAVGTTTSNEASFLARSLDFMTQPTAANKAAFQAACIDNQPARAGDVGKYLAQHTYEQPEAVASSAPVAKSTTKLGSGM